VEVVDVVVTVGDAAGAGSRSLAHSIVVTALPFGGSRSETGLLKTCMFIPREPPNTRRRPSSHELEKRPSRSEIGKKPGR
jgi:hypothetical protein